MIKVDDLIGAKFRNHGRNAKDGFDCYGLAIEVSKRYGHTLEDLWYEKSSSEMFESKYDSVLKNMGDKLIPTDKQEESNLIVFFENGKAVHIGIIIDDDMFMHADIYGVRITKLSSYHRTDWRIYKWQQ